MLTLLSCRWTENRPFIVPSKLSSIWHCWSCWPSISLRWPATSAEQITNISETEVRFHYLGNVIPTSWFYSLDHWKYNLPYRSPPWSHHSLEGWNLNIFKSTEKQFHSISDNTELCAMPVVGFRVGLNLVLFCLCSMPGRLVGYWKMSFKGLELRFYCARKEGYTLVKTLRWTCYNLWRLWVYLTWRVPEFNMRYI